MYKGLRNLTSGMIIIPHADSEVHDIILTPYGVEWVKDLSAWGSDNPGAYNLYEMEEDGQVELFDSEKRPRGITLSKLAHAEVKRDDFADLRTILLHESDEWALDVINVEAIRNTPTGGVDTDYLKNRLLPVLRAAEESYRNDRDSKLPGKAKRLRAIRKRIKALE